MRGGVVVGGLGGDVVSVDNLSGLEADLANNNHHIYQKGVLSLSGPMKMAADAAVGSDTCPSPEIGDSRKRPLEGDTENGTTKRSHYSTITTNSSTSTTIINATANAVGKFHFEKQKTTPRKESSLQ